VPKRRVFSWDSVPEKRVFFRAIRCPRSGSFLRLFVVSDFSSGVDLNRALGVRGEPMVPFVLVTGIRVASSCGRAEECLHCRGRGVPMALGTNRRFLIPKVGQPGVIGGCEMKSSSPFIPTTTRALPGPFWDNPSRRW